MALLAEGYRNGADYYDLEAVYNTYDKYPTKTVIKNDSKKIGKNLMKKPIETAAPFIGAILWQKKISPKLKEKIGSIKDPFDLIEVRL